MISNHPHHGSTHTWLRPPDLAWNRASSARATAWGRCCSASISQAPIDTIGTGSFLPNDWHETYATADIVEYDGVQRVKIGREFLLRK